MRSLLRRPRKPEGPTGAPVPYILIPQSRWDDEADRLNFVQSVNIFMRVMLTEGLYTLADLPWAATLTDMLWNMPWMPDMFGDEARALVCDPTSAAARARWEERKLNLGAGVIETEWGAAVELADACRKAFTADPEREKRPLLEPLVDKLAALLRESGQVRPVPDDRLGEELERLVLANPHRARRGATLEVHLIAQRLGLTGETLCEERALAATVVALHSIPQEPLTHVLEAGNRREVPTEDAEPAAMLDLSTTAGRASIAIWDDVASLLDDQKRFVMQVERGWIRETVATAAKFDLAAALHLLLSRWKDAPAYGPMALIGPATEDGKLIGMRMLAAETGEEALVLIGPKAASIQLGRRTVVKVSRKEITKFRAGLGW